MKKNKKKGFTLVELLVVIAIIAILATVSVVGYLGFTEKAKESRCLSEATQARDAMVAALVDGKEDTFTLKDGVLTGDAANINTVFELGLPADGVFTILDDAGKSKITYTREGYTASFHLNGSPVSVTKATAAA